MTSAKLLFCRHLLTPANIKHATDVGERGLTPSSPTPTEILSFYRKKTTYTLSLCCKLITLISFLNVWLGWHVYKYKEIKLAQQNRSENLDRVLLRLQYETGKLEERTWCKTFSLLWQSIKEIKILDLFQRELNFHSL